jgi:hypothetical protein
VSRTFRLDSARPSDSRTIGAPTISHTQVEIVHQPSHDRELLVVLAPEHRDIGRHRPEQLGHHGHDAAEVARSHRTFEPVGQRAGLHVGLEPTGYIVAAVGA